MNNFSSIDQRFLLYQTIEQLPPENLKNLNQFERKIVFTALQSLKNHERECVQKDLQGIINKLKTTPKRETPTVDKKNLTIKKWFNGLKLLNWKTDRIGVEILSRWGFAITTNQLLLECKSISSQIDELKKLPDLILRKNESLVALRELSRFQTEDALPLYRDIQAFYAHLPNKMNEAEPILEEKIAKVKEQIKRARVENKDKGYVHILEKEILESLTKMRDFQRKNLKSHILEARDYVIKNKVKTFGNADNIKILVNIQSQFNKELELTRTVWGKAAEECENQGYTKEAIAQTKEQIERYQNKLRESRFT